MNEQQKLEILCAYLPHGVEVETPDGTLKLKGIDTASDLHQIGLMFFNGGICRKFWYIDCKPILRHRDDMTEEEQATYIELWESDSNFIKCATDCLRYLHSIHIDTFGAIEGGWAIRKETN